MSLSENVIMQLSTSAPLMAARHALEAQRIVEQAVAIQQIPAPTFQERDRALYVQNLFHGLGLRHVEMDEFFNVYGWLEGSSPDAPVLLVSAHLDTVFPAGTDLTIRKEEENKRIYGAGLGDNSLGVAALLTVAELFKKFDLPHEASLCFLANTREEGLGNLDGMRAALKRLAGRVHGAIVIEGIGLGRVDYAGVGVRRLKLTVTAPGGHSWSQFGKASAIHALMHFGCEMTSLTVAEKPRTTYNIGIIEGGRSVNTIASEALCYIDMRSEEKDRLQALEKQVRQIGKKHATEEVSFHFEVVGDRPSGGIALDHPLVHLAQAAHQVIGIQPEMKAGSTDANILLAMQIPTVCVRVSFGGHAHRLDEFIETEAVEAGLWQLLLLAVSASSQLAAW